LFAKKSEMTNAPRISIVMPSFNQACYIEESIQSILDQDYPDLEFLILDGGSTDGSRDIIKRYSNHLAYWHSRPDAGQTDALVQGFSLATGELMGWCNSDDILLPGALSKIIQAYKSHPEGSIFGGNVLVIDEQGKILRCRIPPSTSRWLASHGWSVVLPGGFFTRKGYEAVGGLHRELNYIMDADLYLRMMHNNAQYIKVNAWVSGFRIHSFSKTVSLAVKFKAERESIKQKYFPWTKPYSTAIYIYKGIQIANGNYLRMVLYTIMARGKHYRKWLEMWM
jgi:glycosyltransferase involved in cell wall biosynthesis